MDVIFRLFKYILHTGPLRFTFSRCYYPKRITTINTHTHSNSDAGVDQGFDFSHRDTSTLGKEETEFKLATFQLQVNLLYRLIQD